MKIDSIKNGIVLDHIRAGKSLEVYKALGLDKPGVFRSSLQSA